MSDRNQAEAFPWVPAPKIWQAPLSCPWLERELLFWREHSRVPWSYYSYLYIYYMSIFFTETGLIKTDLQKHTWPSPPLSTCPEVHRSFAERPEGHGCWVWQVPCSVRHGGSCCVEGGVTCQETIQSFSSKLEVQPLEKHLVRVQFDFNFGFGNFCAYLTLSRFLEKATQCMKAATMVSGPHSLFLLLYVQTSEGSDRYMIYDKKSVQLKQDLRHLLELKFCFYTHWQSLRQPRAGKACAVEKKIQLWPQNAPQFIQQIVCSRDIASPWFQSYICPHGSW